MSRHRLARVLCAVAASSSVGTVHANPVFEHQGISARGLVPATKRLGYTDTRVIYLDHAVTDVHYGSADDSISYTSSLVPGAVKLNGWVPTIAQWDELMDCMAEVWAPFQVTVTDLNPGMFPHITAVLGGTPSQLNLPSDTAAAAPFAQDCGVVDNAMVFAFTPSLKMLTPRQSCELISQQVATAYGLDYVTLDSDVMSANWTESKTFKDVAADCGTDQERTCGSYTAPATTCRSSQNSQQILYARIGKYVAMADPPVLHINYPDDGATVLPGFLVDVSATDRDGVQLGVLEVNGQQVDTIEGPGPYTFDPKITEEGDYSITAIVSDGEAITTVTHTITVSTTGPEAGGGCSAAGGGSGLLVGAALAGVVRRRRRRA